MTLSEFQAHNRRFRVPGQTVKPADLGHCEAPVVTLPTPQPSVAPQARQTLAKPLLNKTEQRWCAILEGRGYNPVWKQAIRLKLAERLHYTPDFAVMMAGVLTFYEVKGGFERDDAIVKLKAAAKLYPDFDFIKAKWANGKWTETLIPK